MPEAKQPNDRRVLVVSDAEDGELLRYVHALAGAGFQIEQVGDVYSAMARLVVTKGGYRVLLDVRTLDDRELTFPRAVGRYFPAVQLVVPDLPSTSRRLAGHADTFRTASVEALIEAWTAPSSPRADQVASQSESSPTALPALSPIAAGHRPLSTDAVDDPMPAQPSLHDAVRARMAGPEAAAARRPPARTPPTAAKVGLPVAGEPGRPAPSLSDEEMAALLADEGPAAADEPLAPPDPTGDPR